MTYCPMAAESTEITQSVSVSEGPRNISALEGMAPLTEVTESTLTEQQHDLNTRGTVASTNYCPLHPGNDKYVPYFVLESRLQPR